MVAALPSPRSAATPSPEAWGRFVEKATASVKLAEVLLLDFEATEGELVECDSQLARRNVVRCFGSVIDGSVAAIREVACNMREAFAQPFNRFLRDKVNDRSASSIFRIKSSYRLAAEVLPLSPFTDIEPVRWDRLHRAIEVRNRIMHPDNATDLIVTNEEIGLLLAVTHEVIADFGTFCRLLECNPGFNLGRRGSSYFLFQPQESQGECQADEGDSGEQDDEERNNDEPVHAAIFDAPWSLYALKAERLWERRRAAAAEHEETLYLQPPRRRAD